MLYKNTYGANWKVYYVFWYIELEYCHHQLPNEAKAEINYTPPPHIIRFFLFILFVEREYLSGLIDITVGLCVPLVLRKELRSCSSSSTR